MEAGGGGRWGRSDSFAGLKVFLVWIGDGVWRKCHER